MVCTSSKPDKDVPSVALLDDHLVSFICSTTWYQRNGFTNHGVQFHARLVMHPNGFIQQPPRCVTLLTKLVITIYIIKVGTAHGVTIALVSVLRRASRTNGKDAG